MIKSAISIDDAVQFRFEPGTGGIVRHIDGEIALVDTPCGERKIPICALKKIHPDHEARLRQSVQFHRGQKMLDPEKCFEAWKRICATIEKFRLEDLNLYRTHNFQKILGQAEDAWIASDYTEMDKLLASLYELKFNEIQSL